MISSLRPRLQVAILLVAIACTGIALGEDNRDELRTAFSRDIAPFLQQYCQTCHGQDRREAKLNLTILKSVDDLHEQHKTWELVLSRLESLEMPPEDAKLQPSNEQRRAVIQWIRQARKSAAAQHAGDPGIVLPRRLSNAEYNYAIRDLTGVDIRPAREFPVDPANEAGFDNSAESLAMSPALLKKYLSAARQVVEHLVLKPEGFSFAPHPVVTDTDRDKYCVKQIVEFYHRQPTDYADYFLAAWRFRTRSTHGQPHVMLDDIARSQGLSPKYLAKIWSTLVDQQEEVGPIARLQAMWRELPNDGKAIASARDGCQKMRGYVVQLRKKLEPEFDNLNIEGSNKGSQPFVLWKNNQYATHRRTYDRAALIVGDNPESDDPLSLAIPADEPQRSRYEAAFGRFCEVFPDSFYVSERGRDYVGKPKDQQEKGRLLSAGFHSMMGYYRDDAPLYDLVLNSSEQRELDRLWQELDFVTSAPLRQYTGFVWFERTDSRFMRDPEFDFARAEDKDVTSAEKISKLSEVYLAKARNNEADEVELGAIADYFRNIDAQIRWVERARLAAEPSHLTALLTFASRAYRRPLSPAERDDLIAFYHTLRNDDGREHEEAVQDVLVSILMSPLFCYRMDLATSAPERRRLTQYELASRLSFFLWSSIPDQELLERAAAGDLSRPEVLVSQTRRMLQDHRVRGLALEFGANWLDFRRFEQHQSVDRERFPEFTDNLRQAMFEEPIRFFVDVIDNDRSVLEFIDGDHTFVNSELAKHYGMVDLDLGQGEWRRVDGASRYQRGGLIPMSVFLTANSPGLRTSPVKRGYWVVRRLLGERIPPPPPNVPELPNDEQKLGELTLRQLMVKHREHKSCAGCHDRFDSIGLALENYGPVGEHRTKDLAGRPVDSQASFPGGRQGTGLEGLRQYLREGRQQEYLDNLCRKLLSYSLGRTLLVSDDALVESMLRKLETNDHRFSNLVESIVSSPQFLYKRGQE